MKTPSLVVPDIYKMLETRKTPASAGEIEEAIDSFGEECKEFLRGAIGEEEDRSGALRLSAIGKPHRKLWNTYWGIRGEDLDGPTYIKFLYGHLTEAMVLALVKLSGHKVTDQQKECWVEGVKGHMDGRIDGVLMDVKSSSSYGFKKFKRNTLHEDDPFGYIPQLKAYAHSEGDTTYGWLAFDKQNGNLAWLQYDESHKDAPYAAAVDWDAGERVRELKKMVEGPLPSVCYQEVPEGKSGNMRLASGCAYCDFKYTCFPHVRTFQYAAGPKYLTKVVRDPRARELPDGF